MNDSSNTFIDALCDPSLYPHAVSEISVIETHISWVILTGEYAYKIKKPIKFSFVDFSTLEKRKFYCYEELRLNARLASNLYLGIVAITGNKEFPSFEKSGQAIEYAVKMYQFPQHSLLSNLSKQNKLTQQNIDVMAKEIADFHTSIEHVSAASTLGTPEDIFKWVAENFKQIETYLEDENTCSTIKILQCWSENEHRKIYLQLQQRKNDGFVRECHGDMHLGNMVLTDDKIIIFDGIDFNEYLRWIDVMSEVAFVTMDLCGRGHPEYANRFINLYLQHTGDYEGLNVFRYYLVYRAVVRAKVVLLRNSQKHLSELDEKSNREKFQSYLHLANQYIAQQDVTLIITYGLSGSGKSTYTEMLLEYIGAMRIRSDIERKRLYGYSISEDTDSKINEGVYTHKSSRETYSRLAHLANLILSSGYSVIVDACFLRKELRDDFRSIASGLRVSFVILEFQASEDVLKQRIITRGKNKNEPSEADLEVLEMQLDEYKPIDKVTETGTITINTENKVEINEIVTAINNEMQL